MLRDYVLSIMICYAHYYVYYAASYIYIYIYYVCMYMCIYIYIIHTYDFAWASVADARPARAAAAARPSLSIASSNDMIVNI